MCGTPRNEPLISRRISRVGEQLHRELNPMLALEKRFLETLLRPVAGLDVVDLGCGTGRWLEMFQGMRPRSLLGVDASVEMLEVARRKLGGAARFAQADCADYPSNRARRTWFCAILF